MYCDKCQGVLQRIALLKHQSRDEEDKKHVGSLPFGHTRLEDGTIQEIPEQIALARKVAEMYQAGFPVMQISVKTEGLLTPRQIYGLMNHWGVKRG